MATIFWAGDSTVQYNDILTFPQTGIGQVMNLFLKPEVRVENCLSYDHFEEWLAQQTIEKENK